MVSARPGEPHRVGLAGSVVAASALAALVSPIGWPVLGGLLLVAGIIAGADSIVGSSVDVTDYSGLVVFAALVAGAGWLFGRWCRRGAEPDGAALLVRRFRPARRIAWQDVIAVTPRRFACRRLTRTAVTYLDGDRPRRVTVAIRWGADRADARAVLAWSPPDHPARELLGEPGSTGGAWWPARVASTRPMIAYVAALWLILPVGWPIVVSAAGTGFLLVSPGFLIDTDEALPTVAVSLLLVPLLMVAVALPGLLSWWGLRRWIGRSAEPVAGGLLVQTWFRCRRVTWNDLLDVAGTALQSYGRAFSFSHTIVTYRVPDDEEEKRSIVSFSGRSGLKGATAITGWLPAGHPLRLTEAEKATPVRALPNPRRVPTETRVLDRLRIRMLMRIPVTFLLVVAAAVPILPAQAAWRNPDQFEGSDPTTLARVFAVLLALVAVPFLVLAVRLWMCRVTLTAQAIVLRPLGRTVAYAVEDVSGFQVVSAGAGWSVYLVLRDGMLRDLYVGASFGLGKYAEGVAGRLEEWRRAHTAVPVRRAAPQEPSSAAGTTPIPSRRW